MQSDPIETASVTPAISILIVSFNTRDVLRECLESVKLRIVKRGEVGLGE